MDTGGESLVLKKFIAGLVGLLGVGPLMQGAVMATDASTDMSGTILIIVGLLLSFGAWRLWPASASNNTHNSTEQHLQLSEPSMVETKQERFSHYKIVSLWMTIVPVIGLVLWLVDSTGDAMGFVLSCFMISIPIAVISTIFAIRAMGKRFSNPMIITILIAIPLAIWEFFNELNNGCSTWGWGTCPPDPPGYDLPRTVMLFYLIIMGVYALSTVDEEDQARTYGIAYGMGFGYLIYVLAWVNGMFG